MRHSDWFRVCVVLVVSCTVSGCHDLLPSLEAACTDDPMVYECRTEGCTTAFECISYCVRHHPEGEGVPASGMGSWCDDWRVTDYGELCREHPAIVGCAEWCTDHDGECAGGGDGDSDVDADGDGESDGDADGDLDADPDEDVDPDDDADPESDGDPEEEPECTEHEDCERAEAAQCQDGECVACGDDAHCAGVAGLPACEGGVCHECTGSNDDSCEGVTPYCDPAAHECVACLGHEDCTEAGAAQCADGSCVACGADEHCAGVAGLSACEGGECHECTAANDDSCEGATPHCDMTGHECVECLIHDQCTSEAEARCGDDHLCVPCTEDEHCAGVADHPACLGGTCVPCTRNAHCAADQVCNAATNACVEACRGCPGGDVDCAGLGGFYCVVDYLGSTRCLQSAAECERPWVRVERARNGGLGTPVWVCAPPPTTSCLGIVEFGEVCTSGDACGIDAVPEDGACPLVGGERHCTYECVDGDLGRHADWCPVGYSCTTGLNCHL